MRHSNSKAYGTAVLRSSFTSCVLLMAIAAAVLAAPSPASAAAPEIAVFTGDTTNAASALTNNVGRHTFPATALGRASTAVFTIQNIGDANLSGLALTEVGSHLNDYTASGLTATDLAPNATATFSVSFEPREEGVRTFSLWIASNDADENPFRIGFSGTGTPMLITRQPADTYACVGSSAQFIYDAGPVASYRWQRRLPGAATFVDISGATSSSYVTPPTVPANHGTAFRARVSRGTVTLLSSEALLSVNDTAVTSPTEVYDFNSTNLAGATLHGHATVANGALELNRLEEGSSGAFLTPDLAPTRAVLAFFANFKVRMASGNGYADGFSFNWATNLPADSYAMAEEGEGSGLSVCFDTHDAFLDEQAMITMKWNKQTLASYFTNHLFLPGQANDFADVGIRLHKGGTVDVSYRCVPIFTGVQLPGYTPLLNSRFGLGARTGAQFETHTIDDLAILIFAPEITVTGNGVSIADDDGFPSLADHTDFGSVGTSDTLERTFTIRNDGNELLTVGSITVGGPQAGDFTVTAVPATSLAPDGSTTFSIGFHPGGAGPRSATVSFSNSDANENPFAFSIQGTGLAAPEIAVFTGNTTNAAAARTNHFGVHTFPATALGHATTALFTIQNTGHTNLSGMAVTIASGDTSDYTVSALSATQLAPNATATFSVNFEPWQQGARSAALWITSNDTDENPFWIIFSGTGTPLQITQQPGDASTRVGCNANFLVDAGPLVFYQWQRKLPGADTFELILDANSSGYVTPPLVHGDHGTVFRARVQRGSSALFSSEALLSVSDTTVTSPTVVYDFSTAPGGAALYGHATVTNGALELNRLEQGNSGAFLTPDLAPALAVRSFVANFKVRMIAGNGYADGFSFNWATNLPQGPYPMAEGGAGSGLSVCFDTYEVIPDRHAEISVKWNAQKIATYRTDNAFLPGETNDFADVGIRLHRDGTVDVSYRCTLIFTRLLLPGYAPLRNSRFGLGAGTGAIYAKHTIDDLAIELDSATDFVDASVPGDWVTATSGNSPSDQGPSDAIDNNVTTKYLNFDKLNTGLTITPFGKRPVRALTLISAEDAPERDPSSFVLEGSNDGTNFTHIASNAVPAFPERNFIQSFAVANANVFNHYRLLFPTVSNALTANSMQIAEMELLYYQEITSSNDPLIIVPPLDAVDVRGVGSLFDRKLGAEHKLEVAYIHGEETIVYITLTAGAKVLKGFELIGASDDFTYPERRPSSVAVAGSSDGVNYTHLVTVIPAAPTSNLQIQEFSTSTNITAFAYYRITFGPPVDGDLLQVGEMRLFGEAPSTTLPPPALSIRASGNNVLVSWPDNPGFVLQTKANLGAMNWTSVSVLPALNNGTNTVTLPKTGNAAFFRLQK